MSKNCETCKHRGNPINIDKNLYWCECGKTCVNGSAWEERVNVRTNYDCIKSMTIDEMAEFMRTMLDCVSCQSKMMNNGNPVGKEKCNDTDYFKMCNGDYKKCRAVCKKWLLQDIKPQ